MIVIFQHLNEFMQKNLSVNIKNILFLDLSTLGKSSKHHIQNTPEK